MTKKEHTMTKNSLTLPLKWHGGKQYLAKRIVAMMPRHLHYVEPFAGGLAVLLERDPNDKSLWVADDSQRGGVSEVANDINGELMNFWRVLQHESAFVAFKRQVDAVPLASDEYARATVKHDYESDNHYGGLVVRRAVKFFIQARQSRAGTFKGFTSLSRSRTRRGINGNASEWLGCIDGLPEVHARLRPVVLENMDAVKLIAREDTPDTLFYLDPPYLHETRVSTDAYTHEMTAEQHGELLELLGRIEGKFILSGYRSDLYDAHAAKWCPAWHRVDIDIANHAAGGAEKRRMVECIWSNFGDAPDAT